MQLPVILTALAASICLVTAAPSANSQIKSEREGLRLIKTSESDPGIWVTEEEKIKNYVAKRIGFFDITDVSDEEVLQVLSTPPSNLSLTERQSSGFPTTLTHQAQATPLVAKVSTSGPQSWLKTLTDFYNRYYRSSYGTQSGTWLQSQIQSIAASNPSIKVTQFAHSFAQPSLIATIPGTSGSGAAAVVMGAHYDSTGGSSSARGPGADDNGSGVVVLLEALRVLAGAGFAPENTLEFHFYAGEEGGLLGSQDVWASYKSARRSVLAFVNQDMAGYSPSGRISVYTDYVDSALTAYVKLVATQYGGAGAPTTDTCGYACSDHASARANGFPASYVCDEPIDTSDPYIHSSRDSYDTVMWDAVLRHAKFTVGFLVEASYL